MTHKLRPFDVAILTYMTQVGIVVFTLPRMLAEHFGTNGWLFLFPCFLLSSINIYLITLVYRLGKGRSVFEILEQSLPKALLYLFYLALSSLWLIFGCMVGKKYVLLFQMLAFPTTNPMIFKLVVDFLIFLMLSKGIYTISRVANMFFWITFWMYLLLLWFLPEFRWVRLTPFIFQGGHDHFKGALELYSSFLGYELSILLIPYIDKSRKPMAAVQAGNAYLSLSYINLSLICFGLFSLGQLKKLLYPLLDLLAYIQFPFIERLENLLFGLFLFLVVMTVVMYWWAAQETIKRIVPKLKIKALSLIIVVITYGISFIPKTVDQVNMWLTNLGYGVTAVAFVLPILLLAVLSIQRIRGRSGV